VATERVVHVIDDDADVRQSLAFLLTAAGLTVRVHDSAVAFLEVLPDIKEGCVVTDVRMPGMDGLELQRRLQQMKVQLPVIVMTGHGDVPMSVRAMKAGAVDFLTKPFRDQDMLDAVSSAIETDRQRRAAAEAGRDIRVRFEALSPREREVMTLVTRGLMNKQVAGELGLSEITVKLYRAQAMRKMNAGTLADLVRMAEQLALHGTRA